MTLSIFALGFSSIALEAPGSLSEAESRPFAIRAERVLLGDGTILSRGTILLQDGRISAVGVDVDLPEGTIQIEHPGTASAGLVALHSYSGAPQELADPTRPVLPGARVAFAFDPASSDFADALEAGITSLVLAPIPASLCGGTSALVKTAGGTVVQSDAQLSLGFSAASLRPDRFPTSHGGAIAELDRLFDEPEGAFARAASRKMPVLFETSGREDVARAVAFAKRHELVGAIQGAAWAGELAEPIHAAGLSVVCGPFQVGEERRDLLSVLALDKAGVPFGFGIDAPVNHPALLRTSAAMCVREGLDRASAWRALTKDAARIAGAAERVGDLAEDLDADIVLWSGDPLDLASAVMAVYVDGKRVWEAGP